MEANNSLPQGCEWLVRPQVFRYVGNSGLLSECALSAAIKGAGDSKGVVVLCSELKKNWGTPVTNSWGPAITLELQVKRHLLAEAGDKLDQSGETIHDGWHYHVSEEDVEGWQFFEHYAPFAGEASPHVAPVVIPYEGMLYGPRVDLSGGEPGTLLAAMTREVEDSGFALKHLPT